MADREKVIRGLECHATKGFVACQDCPYYPDELIYEDDDDMEGTICEEKLAADALALLREQEPRVLSLEEIRSGAVEVAWIEDADKAEVIPGIWFQLSNEGEDEAVDIHIRDGFVGARLAVYGKLWRCWTAHPTEEQMRGTKWEGEKE